MTVARYDQHPASRAQAPLLDPGTLVGVDHSLLTGRSPSELAEIVECTEPGHPLVDVYEAHPGAEQVADGISLPIDTYRDTRGGSFTRFGDLARTRRRHGPHPGPLYPIGFRLASSAPFRGDRGT